MSIKDTDKLLAELKTEKNISKFLYTNVDELTELNLAVFLENLLANKHLKKADVINNSGLDKTYAYHIFSGTKHPSRPKILAIAISMQLTLEETQHLLLNAHLNTLYPRNKWDAVIIIALQQKFTVIETNSLLEQLNETLLLY